jgi:hypothetical protein
VGLWKTGKKHGKGYYEWPNGNKYEVFYAEGVRVERGSLQTNAVDLKKMKKEYENLAKRAT